MKNWLAVACLLALAAAPAVAAPRNVELCFELQVDFDDGHVGDWTTGAAPNDVMIAQGIRVSVTDNVAGTVDYFWADPETGCFTTSLERTRTYRIRPLSKAKVFNDNVIVVLDTRANPVNFGWTAAGAFDPDSAAAVTYTWPTNPGAGYTTYVSNVLAAASFSLHRRYGGLSNTTLQAYREACPSSGSGSCVSTDFNGDNAVFLSDNGGTFNKFQISHELGHLIGRIRDEGSRTQTTGYDLSPSVEPSASSCADGTTPFNHHFGSEEWSTNAANEGLAHFYAAAVWNWAPGSDCQWYSYYDGTTVDCELGSKYLVNTCYGGSWPTIASSNELDWMRFWWDVHSDCDVGFGSIMDVWDAAEPNNWSDGTVVALLLTMASFELTADEYSCFADKMEFNGLLP